MEKHGVGEHVRWETEVVSARWKDDDAAWSVRVRAADGPRKPSSAGAVISAVGQLNRPNVPEIPGQDDFGGPSFHSARWDHDLDLTGKRVAMIGAGASGFQIAPTIADDVGHLTVFQRTAQWMFPNPNYHEEVGPGVQWALRHLPFYGRWYRFLLFWPSCDGGFVAARVDPDYPNQQQAVSEANDMARLIFTDWITGQVGDDPELVAKVVPDYPATGKRTLQDNGSWLRTLTRDDVDLVRTGIDHIESDAVVTVDGERYPADVIVYATGFQANRMLAPMQIVGRDGADLRERWGDRPVAYLGITVPDFPNFFCMYGPGTNLASGGSLIFHSECQMRYISQCLDELIDGHHRSMEPRRDKWDDWHQRTQAEMRTLVWSQPSIEHSFYKNSHGRGLRAQPVAPRRLLDVDPTTGSRRLRVRLIPGSGHPSGVGPARWCWWRWLQVVCPLGVCHQNHWSGVVCMVQPGRWVTRWWCRQRVARLSRFGGSVGVSGDVVEVAPGGGGVAAGEDAAAVADGGGAALGG